MHSQHNPTSRQSLAGQLYPVGAIAATAACLALWAVGYQHTIATALLVGGAAASFVCWRVEARIERTMSNVWWHGYATCLEDTAEEGPTRTVVPFRRGDRNGDSRPPLNTSEVL